MLISAPVLVGTRPRANSPGAPAVEVTAESLPDKFNTATVLRFEVKPGSNAKDWSVESKRAR